MSTARRNPKAHRAYSPPVAKRSRGTSAVVREVSGNGAMWMEPTVEIKRPGEPPVVYGWIEPEDVPALLAGDLQERAVGVRGPEAFA